MPSDGGGRRNEVAGHGKNRFNLFERVRRSCRRVGAGIGIAFGGECSDETLQRMRHGGWVRSKVAKGDGEGGCRKGDEGGWGRQGGRAMRAAST